MSDVKSAAPYHHGQVRTLAIATGLRGLRDAGDLPSLRDVAATIGVTHRALYRHFADKDDYVGAVVAVGLDGLAEAMRAGAAGGGGVRGLMAAYVGFALEEQGLYSLMFSLPADRLMREPYPGASMRTVIGTAATAFRRADEPDREVRDRVVAAWGLAHGLCELRRAGALRTSTREETTDYVLARLADCGLIERAGSTG